MAIKLVQLTVYLLSHNFINCLAASHENQLRLPSGNGTGSLRSLPDLASLCPYNRFCRSSPIKNIPRADLEPCCEKCSCNYDCHETGSCCPDMLSAGTVKLKYPCMHLTDLGHNINSNIDKSLDAALDFRYHVITDCPDTARALEYPKCYQPSAVQDFVIVSDPENGKVYRNKHCAECNDVTNYIFGRLHVDCQSKSPSMYFETFEERENFLFQNCSLFPLPPEERMADMSYCARDSIVIKTCNLSGNWDIYDKSIEEACLENREDQNALFTKRAENIDRYMIFASVYCYLCNVAKNSGEDAVCPRKGDSTRRAVYLVSFFAILDAKMWEADTAIQESRCKLTDIWDPYQELCRPLICPSGKQPIYGNCKGTFSYVEGYAVAINFEVIFLHGNMAANGVLLHILENRIFRQLGNDLACGKCESALFDGNSSSAFFFRMDVFSTKDCTDDTLLKRIQKIASRQKLDIKYQYQGQKFLLEMRLIFGDIMKSGILESMVDKFYSYCLDINNIDESILRYCPRIKLTKDEAYTLGIHNVAENSQELSLQEKDTNVEFKEVCVETYFLAQEARSGSVSTYSYEIRYSLDIWCKCLFAFALYFIMRL